MAEGPTDVSLDQSLDIEQLLEEIARLTEEARLSRDSEAKRRLLQLRHLAGVHLVHQRDGATNYPSPDGDFLRGVCGIAEVSPEALTAQRLRAAILRDGCAIVRGLVAAPTAIALGAEIERAFEERDRKASGERAADGYYEEFAVTAPYAKPRRKWIEGTGGLLAVDSPRVFFELLELLTAAGIPQLVAGYLGHPLVLSVTKTTLRRVRPSVTGAWHQDGAFMGGVRSLNLWLSLSRCGDEAPGLDIVPRRLDSVIETGPEDTFVPYQVSSAQAAAAAGELEIVRPIFEPGDAMLFDDLCLHQTGSDPSMPNTRYAVESWFFAGAGYPEKYAPIAV
jgi:hypothetical protein